VRAFLEPLGVVGKRRAVAMTVAADLDPEGEEQDVDDNAELPEIRYWL
jgi:hypothetical protein